MPPVATHVGRLSLLSLERPGQGAVPAGILLEDPSKDALHIRLRRDWADLAPEEAEVLSELEDGLKSEAVEQGAAKLMARFEDTLSNGLLVTDRRDVMVEDFDRALGRFYREHIAPSVPSKGREFVTHLPRYSLSVAAGPFLENREVEGEGWEEAPPGLRLSREMFIAKVDGRSMEPLIPNGSLCVFRKGVTGSRQGRLVLVEALGGGSNDRYTVKRYRSEKTAPPEGGEFSETWAHSRITLEPVNPDFEAWQLNPDENLYRIVAEFVQVLD